MKYNGLTQVEAQNRLKIYGPNIVSSTARRTVIIIIIDVIKEPMFAMLVFASVIYFMIGDWHESILMVMLAMLSITITVIQEWRSESVIESLRNLTSPQAWVMRDEKKVRIVSSDIVPDDIVFLNEGDRVPADGVLITPDIIEVDESLLTGESISVQKIQSDKSASNNLYAGSLVVQGGGTIRVTLTGKNSAVGKIGRAISTIEMEQPHLQKQISKIIKLFAAVGGVVSLSVIILYGILYKDWLQASLNGIALGMSLLPEEFPLVLTVFMVMGAKRISNVNVLARRAASIEMLGTTTVLCTDKTGTLTYNKMSIARLVHKQDQQNIDNIKSDHDETLLVMGSLACRHESHDPIDKAFMGQEKLNASPLYDVYQKKNMLRHYPLSHDFLLMANIYRCGEEYCVFAKGAPETVIQSSTLPENKKNDYLEEVKKLAAEGLRVIAIASAKYKMAPNSHLPENAKSFAYQFEGLVGFADLLRENVPQSIQQCHKASIRVIMITGDNAQTAFTIATAAGIISDDVITGDKLSNLSEHEICALVKQHNIYARITPDQKLLLVNALKKNGEIVTMTGDGVNDAPSLKAAHIGVAMGFRGTDVARESSSLILMNDDFSAIIQAIRLGRRIYDNLRKAMVYIVAIHVPIAGMAMLPLLLGQPMVLTPLIIALLEMVVDPACSIVIEAEKEEKNTMGRPPRAVSEPVLSRAAIIWALVQGIFVWGVIACMWIVIVNGGYSEGYIRSMVFLSLSVMNIALVLVNRRNSTSMYKAILKENSALRWGIVAVSCIFCILFTVPSIRTMFGFSTVYMHDIAIALSLGAITIIILERLKPYFRN